VALAAACGGSASPAPTAAPLDGAVPQGGELDGGGLLEASTGLDGAPLLPDGAVKPPTKDAGSGGWNGTFAGPITCSGVSNFKQNWSNQCGVERWSIKTGTDTGAAAISLLPELTTIVDLGALPTAANPPFSTRVKSEETTIYALKDVQLTFARLEQDSDYHLVLSDGTHTIITEIPYPGSCTAGSAWQCLISKARAAVDAQINLVLLQGHLQHYVVSVIGVGFYDPEHMQFGASPNTIELHPVLAICFGVGCSPVP
jgi:hypothetical protein